jgi:excisionase family DNA binding protein
MDRLWWTVKELAAHYGMSLRSVYQAIDDGRLVAHRFGTCRGGIRIADDVRKKWEQNCRQVHQASASDLSIMHADAAASRLVAKHVEL